VPWTAIRASIAALIRADVLALGVRRIEAVALGHTLALATDERDAAPPVRDDAPPPPPPDDEVDMSDLVDAPPESVVTPTDRLLQAFPGSQVIDE
jgi:DNA polymerase-3 subunit gamma/tau